MQVPERLALIGGSILLASTLIFTLKSQASSILPKVVHPISNIYDHVGDAQKASEFDDNFKKAQKDNLPTGTWSTAKYYIDKNNDMYVGDGNLQTSIENVIGNNQAAQINSLNFMRDVRAPQSSTNLFSNLSNIQTINGLDKVDTSQVTNMASIFANDYNLNSLDLSNWDTSKLETVYKAFDSDNALQNLNVSNWDTSHVHSIEWTFFGDSSLTDLDLSSWHINTGSMDHTFAGMTSLQSLDIRNFNQFNATMPYSFGGDWTPSDNKLDHLVMGSLTRLNRTNGLPSAEWKDRGNTSWTVILNDGGLHPGDWTKQ